MKNIQINKKWLSIIALLFLVISLSSCSFYSMDKNHFENEDLLMGIDAVIYVISVIGLVSFVMGKWDDTTGGSHWVTINGKTHHITIPEEMQSIEGTGSVERGHRWGNNILAYILYVAVAFLIKEWIGDINGLVLVLLVIIYIIVIIFIHSKVKSIMGIIKYIAWIYTAVDCVLGILVWLWDSTF